MDEFTFIATVLRKLTFGAPEALGLADDAALLRPPPGRDVVVTTDLVIENTHFLSDDPPDTVSRKALRVNASDLAGKGAEPWGWFIGLVVPRPRQEGWLVDFARGIEQDLPQLGGALFGGDTSSGGDLAMVSVTALGLVDHGDMIRRDGAKIGDRVWVSGQLGDAACGLAVLRGELSGLSTQARAFLTERYRLPAPRLALGRGLRCIVHSGMDISDGVIQDLGHICRASGVTARLDWHHIPVSASVCEAMELGMPRDVISAGDDYELLFTAPISAQRRLRILSESLGIGLTEIGEITGPGEGEVLVLDQLGMMAGPMRTGWRHF